MKQETDGAGGIWYWLACAAVIVLAAAIRIRLLGTTLFEDEVWVAELVRSAGWKPHAHVTPPLFYGIVRGWTALRGFSDPALREPALFFGVALCAVPLFAPLPRLTRFTWTVLLAFSSPLVFYSARLKQYTLEAFVAAVLIVLFLRWWEGSRAAMIAFFLVAAIGVTGMHASILVLGALGAISLTRPRRVIGFVAIAILWAVAYVGWLKLGAAATALHGDMEEIFALTGRWVDSPRILVANTLHWAGQALNLVRFWWIAAVVLIGGWLVKERNAMIPAIAILPVAAVATASALHVYPYGEVRLLLFAFPGFFLLLAVAIGALAERVPLALVLLLPFVWSGAAHDPYNRTYMQLGDLHEIYATVTRDRMTIYADPSFAAPLHYYHPEADVRSTIVGEPAGPGWYIQRDGRFLPRGANVVIREGNVLAARVGP